MPCAAGSTDRRSFIHSIAGAMARALPARPAAKDEVGGGGGGRTTTCALVPWNANELTPATTHSASSARPARRRAAVERPARCRGTPAAPAVRAPPSGPSTTGCATRCRSAAAACRAPIAPAAGSVCPRPVLSDASSRGAGGAPLCHVCAAAAGAPALALVPLSRTVAAAPTSMGSPSGVPVPCICRSATERPCRAPAGPSEASSRAARTTSCCAGPLGAVSALLRPSWLTALPAIRASNICGGASLAPPSTPAPLLPNPTACGSETSASTAAASERT
eukprot:363041-Chlamydomonas_euryale.AAC.6